MERYSVTGEDMKRYHILKKAIDGLMSLTRAAEVLGLSYRQVLRLHRLKEEYRDSLDSFRID